MDYIDGDLLAPPSNSILLRVVPSTATTAGGKLVIPHKGALEFLKGVTLSSTCRTEIGDALVDVVDARGDDIAELLECTPGSTGIIVASSYGLSLLLHEDLEDGAGDTIKLSHGCLLVLIETRNDPALFNVPEFVQRLQHISGDVNLTLKEPPKLLYHECENNFVTAPLKDPYARQILAAIDKIDVGFFLNETRIIETMRKYSISWVIWPRILLYIILDTVNKLKWAGVLHKLIPSLPVEERNLVLLLLENMKKKFGDFTNIQKQESLSASLSMEQIMLIQPLVSTIMLGQLLSPSGMLSMSDILLKRATLAAKNTKKSNSPRRFPKLSNESHNQVALTIHSKPLGASKWSSLTCQNEKQEETRGTEEGKRGKESKRLVVAPQTQIRIEVKNLSLYPVCWQVWNLPSKPEEHPCLLLPYSDPASIANVTQVGQKWPSLPPSPSEERPISFEMSDEGVESVILFAWWGKDDGTIFYERIVQQIHVSPQVQA